MDDTPQPTPLTWRRDGPVLVVLILLTLALTWPLPLHLSTHLADFTRIRDDDVYPNLWSFWWARESLLGGKGDFFYTKHLFFPDGETLTHASVSPASVIPFLPVMAAWPTIEGLILSWNLNQLLTFWLAGVGTYLLARRVTNGPWAAGLAAGIFAFSPFHYDHLRHINLSCVQWLPFFFWALHGKVLEDGWRWGLVLTAATVMILTSSPTYATFVALFAVPFLAALLWERPLKDWVRPLFGLLPTLLAAVILSGPALAPLLRDMATVAFESPIADDPVRFAYPIEAFVVPRAHPYVGLTVLWVALFGTRQTAARRPWLWMAIGALALAPGPYLKTLHGASQIPLPYRIIQHWPGFAQNRFCERFLVFWWLGASLLVALAISNHRALRRNPRGSALGLALVMFLDLRAVPLEVFQPAIPEIYKHLGKIPPTVPVYEWPADYLSNRHFMWYQMGHQHPICQGVLARRSLRSYGRGDRDALAGLPEMVLVIHQDFPAHRGHQEKLRQLRKRYQWESIANDGKREMVRLRLKAEPDPSNRD